MDLGKKIAELRKRKGWTQTDLAMATRLSKGYVAAIEGGRNPEVKTVALIAEALGVEARKLFKGEE